MTTALTTLDPAMTMAEVLERMPGARRALFRRYHVGGCSSCGFQPTETLENVCTRNELPIPEVVDHLLVSHEADRQRLISPADLAARIKNGEPTVLVDIRSREEHEAVALPNAVFMTQEKIQALMADPDRTKLIVFYDHTGTHSLDAASYFEGHGFSNVKCLEGGIDAWADQVDPDMPRYQLDR